MKRSAEKDMGSPQKRARNLGYELRSLIPARSAGSIIGKGGNNITRLRSENKATISVPDCPGPERLISISADDQETTLSVLTQIVPLIDDGPKERSRGGSSEGSDSVEVRLLFHHTQVGCIIGKAGAKIKELRETTTTQIKVYGSCCPRSTDRVVSVSGPIDMVLNAIRQIIVLVNDNPIKGPTDQYDPHNYDEVYASQYGGFGDSRGGYAGGGGSGSGGSGGGGASSGDRYGRSTGGRMMSGGGGGSRGGGGPGRFRNDGGRRGGTGRQQRGTNGRHDDYEEFGDEERTTTQVTIPKEFAGAIIGKGGSRIRRIRADSGANITIDEALPGSLDRIITITGANGQIRMAQYLLQQSVKDHGDRKF